MKHKPPFSKRLTVPVCAIIVLFFAIVSAIGDPAPLKVFMGTDDSTADTSVRDGRSDSQIDGVKNSALISAVLFPDANPSRTVPLNIELPAPGPLDEFVFTETSNTQYIASIGNGGSSLLAKLSPQAGGQPQPIAGYASDGRPRGSFPGNFAGGGGFLNFPGSSFVPGANNAGPSPNPADNIFVPEQPGNSLKPVDVPASQNPPVNSGGGNDHDNLNDDDTLPTGLQNNLQPRDPSPVPEPASLLLMLLAMCGFAAARQAQNRLSARSAVQVRRI